MLQLQNLTKNYPGVCALDHISLEFAPRQIHALVGENGAGKSTLIKILSGVIQADSGTIGLNKSPVQIPNPQTAQHQGIEVVHQHSHLIPHLSIAENYALRRGYPRGRLKQIAWSELHRQTKNSLADFAPDIHTISLAESLSAVQKQRVELTFALHATPKVLILDEPTAILPQNETDKLLERIQTIAQNGGTVIFITHRLNEVFHIAHTATVLRDGQHIWTKPIANTNRDDLIQAMVGREILFAPNKKTPPQSNPIFTVTNLSDTQNTIRNITFKIHPGEIYGIYGLVGAGQAELCQSLFGLYPTTGQINLNNQDLSSASSKTRMQSGMAYVPADRLTQGMFSAMNVGENLRITNTQSLLAPIKSQTETLINENTIHTLDIRTTGQTQTVSDLSGGNQQKVLLGRWLQTNPKVLILEEPTQGVDVGAKSEIYNHIRSLSEKGIAILLISSEIPELLTLTHRIGILREGRLVKSVDTSQTTEETLLQHALPNTDLQKSKPDQSPQNHNTSKPSIARIKQSINNLFKSRESTLLLFIILFSAIATTLSPAFATYTNIRDIFVNNTILLIGALGVGCVIIAGSIDIAIGASLGLSAVIAGFLDQSGQTSFVIASSASSKFLKLILPSLANFLTSSLVISN